MATKIIFPKLSLTMSEGTIIKWLKKEGDKVKKGEPLIEVESDKAVMSISSPDNGILYKILKKDGETAKVFDIIGYIIKPEENINEDLNLKIVASKTSSFFDIEKEDKKYSKVKTDINRIERIPISPAAKRIAKKYNLDFKKLSQNIKGSGPRGLINQKDIKRYLNKVQKYEFDKGTDDFISEIIPLTNIRKIIAEKMIYSFKNIPQVTLVSEVNMEKTVELYKKLKLDQKFSNQYGNITYTDLLLKATSITLKKFPEINSHFKNEKIIRLRQINIGLAIGVKEGLIVPVIRDCDKKTLKEIIIQRKALIEKARENKLSPDELQGSTFTISNMGNCGVDVFTPLLNPPEIAILGVGRIIKRPVVVNDEIKIKSMMYLNLTFDHRVIDGVPASNFLNAIKQVLEEANNLY